MYACQQHKINAPSDVNAVLEFICSEANKLTNCGIYYSRQVFFKMQRYVGKAEIDEQLKNHLHFRALRSAVAQQVLHGVVESFNSYKRLSKMFKRGELPNKPRLPKYRKKGGLAVATYPARWVKLVDGMLKFSLGTQVKAWFNSVSFRARNHIRLESASF